MDIPLLRYQNHVKPKACQGFYMILIPRGTFKLNTPTQSNSKYNVAVNWNMTKYFFLFISKMNMPYLGKCLFLSSLINTTVPVCTACKHKEFIIKQSIPFIPIPVHLIILYRALPMLDLGQIFSPFPLQNSIFFPICHPNFPILPLVQKMRRISWKLYREKKYEIWPSPMTKPPIPTENSKTKGQHTQTLILTFLFKLYI